MAETPIRPSRRNENQLQNKEVQGLSGPSQGRVGDADKLWTVDVRGLRLHNVHVQDGVPKAKGCGICRGRLETVFKEMAVPARKDPVDQGLGGDEERSASPPRSDGVREDPAALWP